MKTLMIAAVGSLMSLSTMAVAANAETGTWHRFKAYDMGQISPAAGDEQPCVMKKGEPCPMMAKGQPCPMEKDMRKPCPMMKPGEDCPMMRK